MNEQEIRAIVRSVLAQRAQQGAPSAPPDPAVIPLVSVRQHASHAQFAIAGQADGACIIEPAVACNHCGYCRSYGH